MSPITRKTINALKIIICLITSLAMACLISVPVALCDSQVSNPTGNENTSVDTNRPSQNIAYNANTGKTPWTDKDTSSNSNISNSNPSTADKSADTDTSANTVSQTKTATEQKQESEAIAAVTSQLLKKSGMSQEEYNAIQGQIVERESELSSINAELTNLSDSMHTRQLEVRAIQSLISSKGKEISELDSEIAELKGQIENNRKILGAYAAAYYKFNSSAFETICNVIFQSSDINSVIEQLDYYSELQQNQAQLTAQIEDKQQELDNKREDAAASKTLLDQSQTDLQTAKASLVQSQSDYNAKLTSVQSDIELLKGQAIMKQAGYMQQVYDDLLIHPSNMTSSEATLRANIVKTALSCLGADYVWGGESWGEGGFDCSGLCYYSYLQNGITLPRVAVDQYNGAPHISASDLRPGDLIFFGSTSSDIYHVIMYIGDGLTIEAPNFNETICIRELSGRSGIYGYSSPIDMYSFQ